MSDQITSTEQLKGYIDAQQQLKGPLEISFDGVTYEPWSEEAAKKLDLGRAMVWRAIDAQKLVSEQP